MKISQIMSLVDWLKKNNNNNNSVVKTELHLPGGKWWSCLWFYFSIQQWHQCSFYNVSLLNCSISSFKVNNISCLVFHICVVIRINDQFGFIRPSFIMYLMLPLRTWLSLQGNFYFTSTLWYHERNLLKFPTLFYHIDMALALFQSQIRGRRGDLWDGPFQRALSLRGRREGFSNFPPFLCPTVITTNCKQGVSELTSHCRYVAIQHSTGFIWYKRCNVKHF